MPANLPILAPPSTKGHTSVARITRAWYVACFSSALGRRPIAVTILGVPLVLFRTESGKPAALIDRCPHRNVPLSLGTIVGPNLQCAYHGWQFDGGGACKAVPGLMGTPEAKARHCPSFATRELDGCVWVYMDADAAPETEPFRFPHVDDKSYGIVRRMVAADGTMHAVIENALDVPHTAFLHKGLFRGTSKPNEIEVVVRRGPERVEAEYLGEPRPSGLVGKILSPSGGVVTHFDRFILPCVLQVEYRIGTENHILVSAAATPVADFHTRLFAIVAFRLRLPHWLLKPFLLPIALRIFSQDAAILRAQTESIQRFGGENFASSEIDVLGGHVWRLLRQAERAERGIQGELVERLRLRA